MDKETIRQMSCDIFGRRTCRNLKKSHTTYSFCNNLVSVISRVLIGPYLNFCSMASLTCCNSPRKCTPVKGKVRHKAGYQFVA